MEHTVRSVSLGTLWRGLRYPFILLSALVIPRLMGDRLYGQYAFFMAVYFILDVFTDVGITQTFGRFLPEVRDKSGEQAARLLHGLLFYGVLITAAVIVLAVVPLGAFWNVRFKPAWWLILALLLLFAKSEGTLFAFLYGLNQIGRFSSKQLLRTAASFVFVVTGFYFFDLDGAFWALVLSELLLLAAGVAWTRKYLFRRVRTLAFREFRSYLLFGIQFYVPMLLFSLLQRSGNIFIKILRGPYEQVAYFDVANQFLVMTGSFLGLILVTLLPAVTSLYVRQQQDTVVAWHRRVMTWCGVVVFLACNALLLIGRHVIAFCLGAEFLPVFPSAVVLAFATVPTLIAYLGMNFSLLEKKPSVYAAAVAAGLAFMIVGYLPLVPARGALGAAWASLLGYWVMAGVVALRYREAFRMILLPFAKVLGLGACAAPLYFLSFKPAPAGAVFLASSLLYVLLLVRLGWIDLSDLKRLRRAFRSPRTADPA